MSIVSLENYLLDLYTNKSLRVSQEELSNVVNLTFVMQVYSKWESNYDGEDYNLYTGFQANASTQRYFLERFSRDWYGGWTYDESTIWIELSAHDYNILCNIKHG